MILGYPDDPSVRAGGRLVLRVSTDAPAFRVLVYRCGADVEPVAVTGWLSGEAAPRGAPYGDWDRPGHVVEVPTAWRPGVHLAVLVEGAHFDRALWTPARPAEPTGDDGTPPGFTILGVGDIAPSGWGLGNSAATTGLHTRGGTVFTGVTVDWPRVVAGGTCPALERVTRTMLDRLSVTGPAAPA